MRLQDPKWPFLLLLSGIFGCEKQELPHGLPADTPPTVSPQPLELSPGEGSMLAVDEDLPSQAQPRDHDPESRGEGRSQRHWGSADVDPDNDSVVAPPDEVPDCHRRLEEAGLKFAPARLPLRQVVRSIPTCGCHDAVTVSAAPLGLRLSPSAVMSCQLALALPGLELLIQELAQRHLGEKIRSIHHGGTYSCRKMARFDLVSEHSYGNAIDVYSFTTESGRKISVLSHFGKLDAPVDGLSSEALFLRELSSGAYDRDIVSVSLSPYWDALHRDHFHFDMARYRVDGSRAR